MDKYHPTRPDPFQSMEDNRDDYIRSRFLARIANDDHYLYDLNHDGDFSNHDIWQAILGPAYCVSIFLPCRKRFPSPLLKNNGAHLIHAIIFEKGDRCGNLEKASPQGVLASRNSEGLPSKITFPPNSPGPGPSSTT